MKLRHWAWAGLFLFLLSAWPAGAQQRYLLRARPDKIQQLAARYGFVLLRAPDVHGLALVGDIRGRASADLVRALKSDPDLSNIEPDGRVLVPEHPQLNQSTVAILDSLPRTRKTTIYYADTVWDAYVSQPAVGIINVQQAQKFGTTGATTVAVIDTGIDANHPVLKGHVVPGKDFITDTLGFPSDLSDLDQSTVGILDQYASAPLETKQLTAYVNQSTVAILDQSTVGILDGLRNTAPAFGHGTMVAGLIHLVAPDSRLMPLKAFKADGSGSLYDIVRAVYWAADNGARVINMSFSMDSPSDELQAAIAYANVRGVVCVASAGNTGKATMVYPGGYRKVEAIGSTNNRDIRSSFSNYSDLLVSLAAPGENLITSYPAGNWAMVSGTSFSTALVTGGTALLAQLDRTFSPSKADDELAEARPLPGQELGAGRLDLFQACLYAVTRPGR